MLGAGVLFHDRYEVVRCIGAGGMGAVYEVVDRSTRRRRVLKAMLPALLTDPDMRQRFRLEATVTADIESEHIVEVFDAGFDEAQGMPFLVMEFLRGENLAELLRQRGVLEPAFAIALLRQAALALERTHAAGIVHRDLKPENLFLTRRDDGSPRLKILDFGIAKVVAQSANLTTTRSFGTPLYMSPEQIRGDGDIDARADLYAMGQIAFTLLAGRAYWSVEAENPSGLYSLLLRVVEGAPEPASDRAKRLGSTLPAAFDAWFSRATARLPVDRFESASELVDALQLVLEAPQPNAPGARGAQTPVEMQVESHAAVGAESKGQARAVEVPEVQTLTAVADAVLDRGSARSAPAAGTWRVWRWAAAALIVATTAAIVSNRASEPSMAGSGAVQHDPEPSQLANSSRPSVAPGDTVEVIPLRSSSEASAAGIAAPETTGHVVALEGAAAPIHTNPSASVVRIADLDRRSAKPVTRGSAPANAGAPSRSSVDDNAPRRMTPVSSTSHADYDPSDVR